MEPEYDDIHQEGNEADFASIVVSHESNELPQPQACKKSKALTSQVWTSFKLIEKCDTDDGIQRAECKGCGSRYKCGVKPGPKHGNYGTSTLLRHMETCKKLSFRHVGQMIFENDGKMRSRKLDQTIHRGLLAEAVIKHDLPFCFVEYDCFRAWIKYLNPEAVMPTRNTLVSDINKVHDREKDKLQKSLHDLSSKVCITCDCWTACNQEGYICVTTHFVDDSWKLNSKILNDCRQESHVGADLAATVYDCLKEWGIEKKVFSITLDNASANDVLVRILKGQLALHDSLLCDGEFFHIRCCAHILNLIVLDGLRVATSALHNVRESIKYVKSSDLRMQKFKELVQQVGVDVKMGLRLDVSTRWNSTFLMLQSAQPYKKAFHSLSLVDVHFKCCPTNEDWNRVAKLCEFLEPFYETTNLFKGSSYPTSNLYFVQVWKIEFVLNNHLNFDDFVIRDMCFNMKAKFAKYWSEYSTILAFGAILDPRMKLQFLKFCYAKLDENSVQDKVDHVRDKLYKLFQHYTSFSNAKSSLSQENSEKVSGGSSSKGSTLFREFKKYECTTSTHEGKSDLDLYLAESTLDYEYYSDLDVLGYWKEHTKRFRDLSLLARDVLSIPITTVASESSFSIGSRVLNKYKTCILPNRVQALIRTRNWLHGFVPAATNEDEAIESLINLTILGEGNSVAGSNTLEEDF